MHGGAHPEDVIEEEAGEEDSAGLDAAQAQVLNALDGEGQPQCIVSGPVLLGDVPDAEGEAGQPRDQLSHCRFQLQRLLEGSSPTQCGSLSSLPAD